MNDNNLELATLRSRAFAFVIDDFLLSFLVIIIYWDNVVAAGTDFNSMLIATRSFVLQLFFLKFIYQSFFIWYYGATVGKIITKIRVVDYDNYGRVTLTTAMIRSFLRLLSEMFFYIGFILAFFNDGRQTLHDKIGRTLVINA